MARATSLERSWRGLEVYAVGHSTHPLDHFTEMLLAHGVRSLVDVRAIPRSRAQPQFAQASLARTLPRHGLTYTHLPELGGRRYGFGKASPNDAWKNTGFRGYADHMMSEEFEAGIEALRTLTVEQGPTAIMCAEGQRWRCHRALIADVLLVRGAQVLHLESRTRAVPHRLTAFAHVWHGRVAYPLIGGSEQPQPAR